MPRTSLSNFFARFTQGSIGDAKRQPRYSDDIQLVTVVQDISGAAPFNRFNSIAPPPMASYSAARVGAATAGEGATGLLIAGPQGLWLTGLVVGENSTRILVNLFTVAPPAPVLTSSITVNPTAANASAFSDGRDATAVYVRGSLDFTITPANRIRIVVKSGAFNEASGFGEFEMFYPPEPIFIAPDRIVVLQHVTVNRAGSVGFWWREPLSQFAT